MASVRILIVEDESLVAESVTDMLERLGYSVPAVASSAEDAMARVEETRPDIVLMDIGLPGKMDGVEAANEIRQRFDIPVVYVTAYADEETLQRAKITQPFGYVLKPFQLRELHSAVEIALYRHATDKKLKASEARYRAVSELTSDYAYSLRVKPDGSLEPEWETEAFKRIMGWSMQEIVAQGGLETLLHPDDLPIARQHLQTHLAGLPDVREYRVISRSGQVRWIRDYGQPVLDQDEGRVVRLYGAAQDITEQVEAEEALRHKLEEQAALYESSQVSLTSSTCMRRCATCAGWQWSASACPRPVSSWPSKTAPRRWRRPIVCARMMSARRSDRLMSSRSIAPRRRCRCATATRYWGL
jgi:PAS domain S-box-containing protein